MANAPEIGRRLLPEYWNQGYAKEGEKAVLKYTFRTLRLEKVISFTATANLPSQPVMQKIGLTQVWTFEYLPTSTSQPYTLRKMRSDYLHINFY